ncbi:MAG: CPBP family intramembrane metalloprotease domain-containing protein [Planctomycetaceae bacterium]|nr:CPBP family intramembrane metalloprotease domain-containing protein [Planctomycetaceae bacterium]HAA73402.1 CPBP family intramembrane metalloprotease domain-containing protein [Planctomycetaceae bacterium]|tara:strand:+ start:9120 stop:11378 length:2259 start_codon:yes stop_codon:yes gene_type:complete
MRWSNIRLVFWRECRDQLRDRRTLFTIAVLPLLLYPLLAISVFQVAQFRHDHPSRVWVIGAKRLPSQPTLLHGDRFSDGLVDNATRDLIALGSAPPDWTALSQEALSERVEQEIQQGHVDAVVLFPNDFSLRLEQFNQQMAERPTSQDTPLLSFSEVPEPTLFLNTTNDKSRLAAQRTKKVLQSWREQIVRAGLRSRQIPITATRPFRVAHVDLAEAGRQQLAFWSRLLPFVVMIWALTGAFYPAIDLCAGEKERGTLETLLTSPADRREIVCGKLLTVTTFSSATAVLNLSSLVLTGSLFFGQMELVEGAQPLQLGAPSIAAVVWLLIVLLPISALFSALSLGIAAFARSNKEGQYYLMPLLLVCLPLMIFPVLPACELDAGTSLIPLSGILLLLRTLIEGDYLLAARYCLPVLGVTGLGCWLAIHWAVHQFNQESVLFRESERVGLRIGLRHWWRHRQETPGVTGALCCGLLLLFMRFIAGSQASMPATWRDFVTSQMLVQVGLLAVPAVLLACLLGRRVRDGLLLRWPGYRPVIAGGFLAVCFHPLGMELTQLIHNLYPLSDAIGKQLRELESIMGPASLGTLILTMAVLPAICEELTFRGLLFSGLRRSGRPGFTILTSSLFFGAIHGVFQQSLSAFVVGILIGGLAWRTSSILPGILFHFTYNGLSVLLGMVLPLYLPKQPILQLAFDGADGALRYHPLIVASGGLVCLAIGLWFRGWRVDTQPKEQTLDHHPDTPATESLGTTPAA